MIGEQIIKRTKLQPTQKNKRKGGYLKAFSQLVGGKRPFFVFRQGDKNKFYQFPCYQKNECTAVKKILLYQTILSIK